jgi:hypothetical protein
LPAEGGIHRCRSHEDMRVQPHFPDR